MEEEIAIVGIGCRFPGADNIDEYWRVLVNGENHVVDIPPERWNNEAFYSEDKDEPGKHYVKKAGFISKHDEWDNKLFQVSENEAERVDPQQRYVLECTHMAMEDGGITRKDLQGSSTGVYIGVMNDDYKVIASSDHNDDTNYSATGMSTTIIASRVSFTYNLQGPCMVIDTACSSSMIAIHLGSQAIRTGDCEMAVCGGVSSIISPDTFMALCKARMMSPTGQCQTFCDTADGYARGEGCGIVILKSYAKAIRDGNKIWGIVKTGSNQDGRVSQPITAPSGDQQEELLKKVYKQYNVDPSSLQYIEAHGTGTPIGDPTEANALGRFISLHRGKGINDSASDDESLSSKPDSGNPSESEPSDSEREDTVESKEEISDDVNSLDSQYMHPGKIIPIGSVKTNIGHTESAAGVAALIKVLLMMKNGKIVPSLHVKKDKSNLNQKIKLDEYGLDIALDVADWLPNEAGERICCVNSFGFGGSNSHAIVMQNTRMPYPSINRPHPVELSTYDVICLSALDANSLKNTMALVEQDLMDDVNLQDLSYTSAFHRDHYPARTILFGTDVEEIQQQLKVKMQSIDKLETSKSTRKVFVFCGVGTTWQGMCAEMMASQPVFRNTISIIDQYLQPLSGWSIADKFKNVETDYSDPFLNHIAIFCTQVALFALWKSWGVTPDSIIGQSVGEVAAAHASGALPLKDAVNVIYYRSKILAEMTGGKMMVAGNYAIENIEALCEKYDNKVTIAVYNSPSSCTLSGDADVMEKIKSELEDLNDKDNADIMIRPLSVQCAYHSHQVDSCMNIIESQLKDIHKGVRRIEHISTVTGDIAENEEFQTGKYWAENIRQPVKFMHAILKASREGVTNVFIEIGPRQVLRAHLPNIMGESFKGISLPSMNGKKECVSVYSSLSTLFELGSEIDWRGIISTSGIPIASPRYGFNKTKFLYIPESAAQMLQGIPFNSDPHMYVRRNGGDSAEFRILIEKESTPFVYDHYFLNAILVPGATYVEAAFECGQRKSNLNAYELSVSTEFVKPFTPPDEKQYQIDIEMTEDEDIDGHRYAMKRDNRTLCHGTIVRRSEPERAIVDISHIQSRCKTYKNKEESYACLERIDFNYGESLSLIEQSWSSPSECLAEFIVPEEVKIQGKATHLHPSIIDAMFQTFGILSTLGTDGPTLPKGLSSIVINRPPQARMFGYSQMVKATPIGNHYNSMLLSTDGHVIAEIKNFYTKTIRISDAPNQSIVYDVTWHKVKEEEIRQEEEEQSNGRIVVFGTRRFINCYQYADDTNSTSYELNDSLGDTESMYRMAFDQINNIRAFVFAPCYHVQNLNNGNKSVYQCAKHTFLSLATLIKVIQENNVTLPIFVITENVKAAPDRNISASNVCGGELWGMVRSAMAETAYGDLRIIDMSLTDENAIALESVLNRNTVNYNEYLIDSGDVFYNEFIEDPEQDIEPNYRELDYEHTEDLILKSTNPAVVTNPHFQLKMKKKEETGIVNSCKIRLNSIFLHDSAMYPTSTVSEDAENNFWPENDENGFQVVCIEGIGWLEDKNKKAKKVMEKTPKVGFCYPVDVSSIVSIPSKCTFDIGCLQTYTPGTMSVGVLLWNIVELCKQTSSIFVIVEDDSSSWINLLKALLSKMKKVSIKIEAKEKVVDPSIEFAISAQTLVVLSTITAGHIEVLRRKFSTVQKIISIEEYFPRYMQRWMHHNMKSIVVHILNTEKLFTYSELTDKVPKVYNWLKTLDNSVKDSLTEISTDEYYEEKETSIFNLPYPELHLNEGKNTENYIPLKVFRTEVFRKNGCYVLIGGLTGLGWELLLLMAELGAGYISTFSRRPPSDEKQVEIEEVQKRFGCRILPMQVDITDIDGLKKTLLDLQLKLGEAQIKGVFHGGGVINDMLLNNMTLEDVEKPLQPKVLGTWNLHMATLDLPLDYFVLHSSIVAIFGNPGQCNYSAGNSFQDSFAHYRRSLGLCGQSINWSTLSLGMAAENTEMEKNFKSQGFYYLHKDDIRACFMRAVMTNPPQVTFGVFDWSIMEFHPTIKSYPFKFVGLLDKYGTKNATFKKTDSKYNFDIEEYNNANDEEKKEMIMNLIKKMAADTFIADDSALSAETRFVELGIDSMAAMSFANSVFDTMQVRIPVVTLLSDTTTIESLTLYLTENIQNGGGSSSMGGGDGQAETNREDNRKLLDYLRGTVTFMQRSLLNDYVKNPHSRNLSRQADYEVTGLKLKPKDWRVILNHLVKMNPELRRIYKINKEELTYESVLLPADEVEVEMQQVPFESICNGQETDDRDQVYFDLTRDLPIRFKIACKKNVTRMRMFIHSVISDLSGVAMLFRDIGSYMKPYICNESLPEKDTSIVPADAVRTALNPRMPDLKQYWKMQLSQDIHPFTFSDDIEEELDEANWYQFAEDVPLELVNDILNYTKSSGLSLYNFIVPVYMLFLYEKTNKDLIPLVTNNDMRGHVPQLKSFVTRCINAMPVIGDMRNLGKVSDYIKKSSTSLHRITQQSAFPYALIQDEMPTEELKKHIGRHRIVMDNMAHLNQTYKHNRVTIKVSNVHHTRYVYETTLYIMYDLQENKVALQYGYNTRAVKHEDAAIVPGRIMELMRAFLDNPDAEISDILSGNIVINSIPKSIKAPHMKISNEHNSVTDKKSPLKQRKPSKTSKRNNEITNSLGSDISILRQDCFIKQTSQGWEHTVQVSLALDMSIKSSAELVLQWGKINSSYKRHLQVDSISEVSVKKLNGMYNIFLRTANKWFVLKTMSQNQATDWLETLKNAVEERKRPGQRNGKMLVEHL